MRFKFLTDPPLRACIISVAVFIVLHTSFSIALHKWVGDGPHASRLLFINVAAYGLYLVTGFLAGVIAGRHQVLLGTIAAFLAASVAVLVLRVGSGDAFGLFPVLVNGAVLGGIGGACSLVLMRHKTRKARDLAQ